MPKIPSGKGFGSKPKKPQEDKQSTFSSSYVRMVGVISAGPCEGIVGHARGVFIDGTPMQNQDGSLNFTGLNLEVRTGTQYQPRIAGFADQVASEKQGTGEVKANLPPPTKTIINKSLDAISVSLGFVLEEYPPDGGVLALSVTYQIWIKEGNGAFVLRLQETMSGRYSSLTVIDRYFPVNNANGTNTSFQVRVVRVTPQDADLDRYRRFIKWQSYTEIIETRLRYPFSQITAIQINADQFDSVPEFSFLNAGRLIEIPNNGTVAADRGINYSGIWGGGFVEPSRASSDPAWILYDLLVNPRYGMGRTLNASMIDKYSFYEASKFFNQMVPDGKGGMERRFSCNVVFDGTKEDAWRTIDALRSIFRGFAYYQNGVVSIAVDKPESPIMQFTQADVTDGIFNYVRPPLTDRYSVALVTWIDPNDQYQRAIETVEVPELIELYGYRLLEITAFACTSQGQARRAGLAALLQPETVTFTARRYSAYCRPGNIIRVADNRRSEAENAGIIVTTTTIATATQITLDRPVSLSVGVNYVLSVMMPTGLIEERPVTSTAGNYSTITTAAFSQVPPDGTNWILISPILEPQLFRVVNVVPIAESNNTEFEIFALEYNPSWRDYIDLGWQVQPRPTRQSVPAVISKPRNVAVKFLPITATRNTLLINWEYPTNDDGSRDPFISAYYVELKRGLDGDWGETKTTSTPGLELDNVLPDFIYVARVASIAIDGKSSAWVESPPIYANGPNITTVMTAANQSLMLAVL
jgi:predicted phage tail protein